jgi:hypothetical protein
MMNWCCDPFRNAATNRENDGFVAYAVPPKAAQGEPQFGFGFRAIRSEHIPQLQAAVRSSSATGNLKLTGAFRFRFCPWCGVRLAEHYRSCYQEFADEALLREFEFI